jgi:hypothetical protein
MLRVLDTRNLSVVEFEGHHSDPHVLVLTSVPAVAADHTAQRLDKP